MAMLRLIGGLPLIVGGNVSTTEACCCTGACCDGTTCSQKTAAECVADGGMFRGAGTGCSPNPCQACGSCCEVDGTYDHTVTEAGCETAVPQYLCELELLDTSPCPEGWFAAGPNCYKHTCAANCDSCVTDPIHGGAVNCFLDSDRQYCAGSPGVWHAECPEVYCLTYSHFLSPVPGGVGGDYFEETITLPEGCDTVSITGGVDDDLLIDGEVVQPGAYQTPTFNPGNPAHTVKYSFTPTGGSFTIAVRDNYGIAVSAELTICFYPSVAAMSLTEAGNAPLTLTQKIGNFAKSAVRHVASGMPLCTQEQVDERFAICQGCEFLKDGACLKCGCPLVREKKFLSKLSWANESCPVGKWGPVGHSSVGPDASAR